MKASVFFSFCTLLFLLGNTSCKKWLDTRSDKDLYVEDVLTNRQGFSTALAGIYAELGDKALYGREMEFGMLDVLAGYWQIYPQHIYYPASNYDYRAATVESKINAIWSGMYRIIRQCNIILAQIDNIKTDPNYAIIKGETLAIRAFCHFELLKLFGPVIKTEGHDTPAIPYYTTSGKLPGQFSTSRVCFQHIEADLQLAKTLLAQDPIRSNDKYANLNKNNDYNFLLDKRGIHMNYFAVSALLARKSLWEGNMTVASDRATQLMNELPKNTSIHFVNDDDLPEYEPNSFNNWNFRFTRENIWGLYINNMKDLTTGYVSPEYYTNGRLVPDYTLFLSQLYTQGTGSINDIRYWMWLNSGTTFYKLIYPSFPDDHEYYDKDLDKYREAQLINLPEIYFILTETYLDQDLKKSLDYLNIVRYNRSLPPIAWTHNITKNEVLMALIDEVRREYIGEGFLFTFYKRLNLQIYRSKNSPPPIKEIFNFPVPEDEQLYNPNH
ncbi:RagB/SusD family nutrient uptake outer membrane protein [Sphingobacterium sp.]|uniref:RagB/SusD family nutrient uptake outer membrane protein n=1 Tax=Sphingobacterium sp. TaxID=341027 RepID=UPI0031D7D54A